MDTEEKVFRIYEVANQRAMNEDRLLAERAGLFLMSSSILFAGFAMLIDNPTPLKIVVPAIGIFLCVLMWSIGSGMIRELCLWLNFCAKIEQEEDAFKDLKKRELIPHSAWKYWWAGTSKYINEEDSLYLKLPPVAKWEKRTSFGILDAWKMYRFYLPAVFLTIWMTALLSILLAN